MTRALVVGFGVTGRAVARALVAAGHAVVVTDDHPGDDAAALAAGIGAELVAAPDAGRLAAVVADIDLVVPSPGVAVSHPVFGLAAAAGATVWSEIELAWRTLEARAEPRPALVAITGTNGKTTVTTWVAAALVASGCRAVAAGNIGPPLIDAVATDSDVVVAEVSSFQLQFTERFRPAVCAWLNLAPDHLDWHPSMTHYGAAKARIWANQGAGDTVVINLDDPLVVDAATSVPAGVRVVGFSVAGPGDFASAGGVLRGPGGEEIMAVAELPRHWPHDVANALAAAAVALAAGATPAGCREALASAPGLPHRVELVVEAAGVRWYDDSKATTPASVLAAVAGFKSVVLIAGGHNKGLDLGVLAAAVPPVRAVVAIGEAAGEVAAAFAGAAPVVTAATMAAAVRAAAGLAREGDAVVLSPGCASFDWYSSYGERGRHFAALVRLAVDAGTVDAGTVDVGALNVGALNEGEMDKGKAES